jgi:hypothetical protein
MEAPPLPFVIPSEVEGPAVLLRCLGKCFSTEESWAFGPPKGRKTFPGEVPLNCRSLGFARDDKGEAGASMESSRSVKAMFFDRAYPDFYIALLDTTTGLVSCSDKGGNPS